MILKRQHAQMNNNITFHESLCKAFTLLHYATSSCELFLYKDTNQGVISNHNKLQTCFRRHKVAFAMIIFFYMQPYALSIELCFSSSFFHCTKRFVIPYSINAVMTFYKCFIVYKGIGTSKCIESCTGKCRPKYEKFKWVILFIIAS